MKRFAIALMATALVASFACAGCGASSPPPPPASPASAPPPSAAGAPSYESAAPAPAAADVQVQGAPPAADAAPPSAPVAPVAPSSAPPPTAQSSERRVSMADQVLIDLRLAERQVAAGDCPTACRALASMERAVTFLCMGNQTTEDADRCAEGKRRVGSARRRIRATCGACPGGPTVDPDAPIPSKR